MLTQHADAANTKYNTGRHIPPQLPAHYNPSWESYMNLVESAYLVYKLH